MIELQSFDHTLLDQRHNDITGLFELVPPAPVRIIQKIDFMLRMTQSERTAIQAATLTDPKVYDFKALLDASPSITLDEQHVIDGLNYLEAQGKLAAGRSAAIRA